MKGPGMGGVLAEQPAPFWDGRASCAKPRSGARPRAASRSLVRVEDELARLPSYRRLAPRLGSAGQPDAAGIQAIARAGFTHLINLALPTSPGALANESELAARAGLAYLHLPIDFEAPELEQAARLFDALAARLAEPVMVHCAKNLRVSSLLSAYRMVQLGVPSREARA